jgi:hypothetical protein
MTLAAFRRRALWGSVGVLWLGAVVGGLGLLAAYDRAPGVAAQAREEWPAGTGLVRDARRPTLVMIAHPRCTCTRASVGELAELMARAPEKPRAYVVFIRPGGTPGEWEQTDLWRSAERIPGVTVVRDDRGVEAERFGAETSGQTFLYGSDGRLLYSGGTTGSRAHPGDNAGRAAILALLKHETPSLKTWSVFGCSLFAEADRPASKESGGHGAHVDN